MKGSRFRILPPTQMHTFSDWFLEVRASPKHVLASFDVSNAFLNAELSEDVLILTHTRIDTIWSCKSWHSLPVYESVLWIERGTMGRGQG